VAFSLAMLVGRTAGGRLVRAVSIPRLFIGELFLASIGFALYWGVADPRIAISGLFLIGLGVALLYPLALDLAVSAAGEQSDAASARTMLAVGLAILIMPAALGGLADTIGLHRALLMLPALIGASFVCFVAGRFLQRRAGLRRGASGHP
jgi:fucose permease